jgi:hypothetical protein
LNERESKKPADNPPLVLVYPVEGRSDLAFKLFAPVPKDDEAKDDARGDGSYEFARVEPEMAKEKTRNV